MLSSYLKAALSELHYAMIPELVLIKYIIYWKKSPKYIYNKQFNLEFTLSDE